MGVTISGIEKVIPHRTPFLFITEVTEFEAGKWGKGYYMPRKQDFYFEGHFPENPIFPGVLMIEATAQLGAFVVLSLMEYKGKMVYFGGIEKARFRRIVVPGERLDLYVKLDKLRSSVGKGSVSAEVSGELCFEGVLTFAIR